MRRTLTKAAAATFAASGLLAISRALLRMAAYEDAMPHLLAALSLRQRLGDLTGEATAQFDIGKVFERQQRYSDALPWAEKGLELYQAAGHRSGEATGLNIVGWLHALLGDYDQAVGSGPLVLPDLAAARCAGQPHWLC